MFDIVRVYLNLLFQRC